LHRYQQVSSRRASFSSGSSNILHALNASRIPPGAKSRFNGLFTATLLRVYRGGNYKQNYAKFAKAIRKLMPSEQQPRHYVIGPRDHDYDAQPPFAI
jgi:hypothetical protein